MTAPDDLTPRLRALAALLPHLEAGTAADFGTWVASREDSPGVWTMPYVEYGPLESRFRAATAGWVRPDIHWMEWANSPEGRSLMTDPERIARATPEALAHILTTAVRGDRFNEGMLLSAFERGILTAVARRASALLAATGDDRG
jgi:Family of unknown function (DUF6508)